MLRLSLAILGLAILGLLDGVRQALRQRLMTLVVYHISGFSRSALEPNQPAEMSETRTMLMDAAQRVLAKHIDEAAVRRAEQGEWLDEAWDALGEFGAPLLLLPEQQGGFGLPFEAGLGVIRLSAAHIAPLPLAETMIANLCLTRSGMAASLRPLTLAPQASLEEAISVTRHADGWHVKGTVTNVPWGRCAELVMIAGGQLLRTAPGMATLETGVNMADVPRDTLHFDCVLPESHVAPADNMSQAAIFAMGAAARAAQMAGALDEVLSMTTRYASEREQFGRPLAKFQAVQQNLAALAGAVVAAGGAADLGASELEAMDWSIADTNGLAAAEPKYLAIAAAKSRAGEAAGEAAGLAHQIFAAIGFTREHRLNLYTRALWSWREEFGNEAFWNLELGRAATLHNGRALWPMIASVR